MKAFLASYVGWVIFLFCFMFFGGSLLFDNRHFYAALLVVALVPAVITLLFYRQSEEIDRLKERIHRLEEQIGKEDD